MMVTPTRKHAVFLRSSSGLCRESSSFYIKGLFILTLVGCSAAQDFRVTVESELERGEAGVGSAEWAGVVDVFLNFWV